MIRFKCHSSYNNKKLHSVQYNTRNPNPQEDVTAKTNTIGILTPAQGLARLYLGPREVTPP